ncbi:M20/M25/M40 family metallo-hydrolase [Streptomyces spinosirectus]|jgi:LysW-gamma-L-lysine carboxypeptidase|uniref:M20/M25/M40 family metallo-hydrolase n=1 Tax=Streptomyces TaxID=1883 RepID=UPI000D3368B5|nr:MULTISPECIES: M20/M25/M40 family metallo-hydrolase [Streptomyces]MBY8338868.1 M20/M25/M40 family metallo-hydrolase [Streptomyces plumbidurans]PTN00370.1 acetylornithine deacetylase [Streptomyces sp. VMFN-G11Ma]UIR20970.1 M20/M25/M40 family metallo-hydrolase [Streptomyces spinosirectus]
MTFSPEYPAWLLRAMLCIPSVSGQEGRLAAFLAEQMAALGMDAHVDAAGNAHGVAGPPDAPVIMLLGHIDTVPGRVPVCHVGDLLYGRGAVDAKGPMAAMICAAARARGVRVHVVGAVGEEVAGSRGARHLMSTLAPPAAVLIGEPSGWDGVCLGYKGRVGVGYETSTPPLHTSSPVPTAVEAAAEFSRRVKDYLRAVSESADPVSFGTATGTLVRLTGDLSRAEAFLTCRVPPGFDFEAFERHVTRSAGGRVRFDERVPAVRRPRSDVVVSALRAAIRSNGGQPALKLKSGTSDMNVVEEWGVPMAAYGPGDAHLDHTSDEHIAITDLIRSVDVLTTALGRISGQLRGRTGRGAAVCANVG